MENQIKISTITIQNTCEKRVCKYNNESTQSCFNNQCTNPAFVCLDPSCQCRKQHKNCLIIQTKSLQDIIISKIIPTAQIEIAINDKIQKCIDQLSNLRDRLILKLKQQDKYFGLLKQEEDFLSYNSQHTNQIFTGKYLWNIHSNCKSSKRLDQKSILSYVNPALQMIYQTVHKKGKQIQKSLNSIRSQTTLPIFHNPALINTFKNGSLVIKTNQEASNMLNFFDFKKIKSLTLLYRASQSQFSIHKFHTYCDNRPNTFTVIETEFGKKLGGYTPLEWYNQKPGGFVQDYSQTSFLFSLTNNHKFTLANKKCAIYRWQSNTYGPTFGAGHCFNIYDKANTNHSSYFQVKNEYYTNKNYKNNDSQNNKLLGGNPNSISFKIYQMQVWQVFFENQQF